MIKAITFAKTNSLMGEEFIINFSKNKNIIIGPKGGGKSTLFDLLIGLEQSYIPDSVTSALKEFNMEFISAKTFNDEIIHKNNLDIIKKKEKLKRYENRNNIIFQDDPIKKDINSFGDIDKEKMEYAKETLFESEDTSKFISKIKEFHLGMHQLSENNKNSDINWTNTFRAKNISSNSTKIITDSNYNVINITSKIKSIKNDLSTLIRELTRHTRIFNENNLDINKDILEHDFMKNFNDKKDKSLKITNDLITIIKKEIINLERKENIIRIFNYSYKKLIEKIKNENNEDASIQTYLSKSTRHFESMANKIKLQNNLFKNLTESTVELKFIDSEKSSNFLSYKMPLVFKISSDNIYKILKIVLPTPGSAVSDLRKWLEAVIKNNVKEWNEKKIRNALARIIKDEVQVIANGKNYESMSLGQKSIYGIEYKLNNSKNSTLYLDQPEDNLDNYTITQNILKMIENNNNQIFIVTHNANIGILTDPESVIVADLSNKNDPYYEARIEEQEEIKSDAAHFLEGGSEFLKKRYLKIKGENNDIKN